MSSNNKNNDSAMQVISKFKSMPETQISPSLLSKFLKILDKGIVKQNKMGDKDVYTK